MLALKVCVIVGVALAAGGRHVEFVDGRLVFVGGEDRVRAVAVGADGGLLRAVFDGATVHALLVGDEGLRAYAVGLHRGTSGRGSGRRWRECWRD